MSQRSPLLVLTVAIAFGHSLGGDRCYAQPPADAAELKAIKYLDVLRRRPEPGYLYDRFYNTWLDESTVDELEQYLTARVAESSDTADRLMLAFFYAKQGDDVAALEQFRTALQNDPASAATWFHKALVEARTLDFETAIADLQKARQQNPDEKLAPRIDKELGKLLVRNGRTDEALAVWRELLAANPGDEELREDMIELHLDEGLFQEAAALAEDLIAKTSDPYLAVTRRMRLGDIHHRSGSRGKALDVYNTALEQVGFDSWLEREVLAQIEQVFRREDDLTGLKDEYAKLLEEHGKRIALHRRHAELLAELGEADAAVEAYQRILQLTPGDRANREQFVALLARLERHDQAVEELETLCRQHSQDAELRFRLATLRQQAGQLDSVADEVNQYLKLSDGSEYAYLRAARLLERLDKIEEARQIYEKMVETHADSASAQEAFAAFLYSREQKPEAVAIWRKLAATADLNGLLHVARGLTTRSEHQAVFDLLMERREDFQREPLYLGQLIASAVALKKYTEAIPWVLERVARSESVTDLESAIEQAVLVCDRAEQVEDVARQLAARPTRLVGETCLMARLYEENGDSGAADEALSGPVADGEVLAVSQQIALLSERRDWTAAANATRRILELPGGQKSLHVRRLVELYGRDYQIKEALSWIETWKRLSPGSAAPWLAEARLLRMEGNENDALMVLRKACQRFEDDEDLRANLAQAYTESEMLGDAERIYWQLYDQTEDLFGKLRWVGQLARLSEQQGKTQQLVENLEERARTNRQSIVPLLSLAEVYREADDYEGRRRALTAATKVKPDDPQLLMQIARIEESEGDWRAALATLEQAAQLDKTNNTREKIARLHLEYGDPEDGYAILYELAGGEDSDPRAIEAIADAMCSSSEWERAAEFLGQRVGEHPRDYRLQYLYAVALEESGQTEAAVDVFVRLLDDQEELPGKSQPMFGQSMGSYADLLKQMAPQQASEWLQLSQYRYTVYQYQQQRSSGGAVLTVSLSGTSRSSVNLPGRVEDLRTYALTHLITLVSMLTEEETEHVAERMESQGVTDAAYVLKLGIDQNGMVSGIDEILEEEPQHECALALHVLRRLGQQLTDSGERSATAFEVFRQSYPQLSIMAAVQAASQDEQYAPLLDEAVELAEDVDSPSPLALVALVSAVGGPPFQQQSDTALDDARRQKVLDVLIDWYPHMQRSPQYATWSFLYLVAALAQGAEFQPYLDFLEDEVARAQTAGVGASGQQIASMFGHRANTSLIQPLEFPPRQLVDFPSHVLALLGGSDSNRDPYSRYVPSIEGRWETAAIVPKITNIKHPVLRLLLARQVGAKELLDQTLEEMLAAEQPRADAYLLAAARASDQQDDTRAAQLLEKVRYLPMSRELRGQVDAALVALALKTSAENDEGKQLKETGRHAALRLRRNRLDANQRNELIAALDELGLMQEAEKLERVAAATPYNQAAPAVRYSAALGGRNVQNDRVARLVEEGKPQVAAKLLAREVLAQASQLVNNLHNFPYRRQQSNQVADRVRSLALEEAVLAELEPGESSNPSRLLAYASACELFGKTAEARAAFEKYLERRPKDDNTRMLVVMLLAESDPSAADPHLELLGDAASQTMGQVLGNSMQHHQTSLEQRMALGQLAYRYFVILKDRKRFDASWVEYLVQALGRQMHSRSGQLPSLYGRSTSDERSSRPDALAEVDGQRRQLHEKLCRSMLEIPATARSGFRCLLASVEADGEEQLQARRAELVELAKATLRLESAPDPQSGGFSQVSYYTSSNPSDVRFRGPEEYLVRLAWKEADWSDINEKLLPELKGARRQEPYEALGSYVNLYRADDERFVEVAQDVVRRFRVPTNRGSMDSQGIAAVVDAWIERDLAADIRPLVLQQVEQEIKAPNHHQPSDYLLRYIMHVGREQKIEHTLSLLDDVATLYVGPAERREEFIKRNYQPNMFSWGTPSGNIYVFRQMLERLIQDEHLVFATLRHMEPYGEVLMADNMQYYLRSAVERLRVQVASESLKTLEQSSWLGELEQFQPLDFANAQGESLLESLLNAIIPNDNLRQEFEHQLTRRHEEKPTFGTGLLLAAVNQKSEPAALVEYIGQHVGELRALPAQRQATLASVLAGSIDSDVLGGTLSPSATAGKEWLEQHQAGQAQRLVADLLKAKRLEELGVEYYNVEEYLAQRIPQLMADDPVAARSAFIKVCELAEDSRRRGQWHYSYSDGETLRGRLLAGMINRGNNGQADAHSHVRKLRFVVDLLTSDEGRNLEINQQTVQAMKQSMQQAFQKLREDSSGQNRTPAQDVQQLHGLLAEEIGDRPASVLLGATADLLWHQMNDHDRPQVRQWLEKANPSDPLISDWLAALELAETARGRPRAVAGEMPFPEPAEHHAHLGSVLENGELPLVWRLEVAFAILEHEKSLVPLETALTCLRVYKDALADLTPIPSYQHRELLNLALSLSGDAEGAPAVGGASELIAACREEWAKRYLRAVRTNRQSEDNPHLIGDSAVHCRALKLYLLAQDRSRLEECLRYHESRLGANRMALALLVRHGEHELATQLMRTTWNTMDVHYGDPSLIHFDTALSDELPEFVKQQSREDGSYLAEVFIASLPDGQALAAEDEDRQARLVRLARRYNDVPFEDDAHRNRVLEVFTTDWEAGNVVADAIALRYAEINLLDAARSNDHQRLQQLMHVVQQHCRNRYREGDPQPFVETIEKFAKHWAGDQYYFGQATEPLIRCTLASIREDGASWTREQCDAVAKALRQVLQGRDQVYLDYFRDYNTLVLLTHARAGKVDELATWYAKLGDNSRSWMQNHHLEQNVWETAKKLVPPDAEDNLAERTQLLRNMVRGASALGWLRWESPRPFRFTRNSNETLVHDAVNYGLLSTEEVTEVALELVDGEHNDFNLAGALAGWLADHGQQDAAVMLWRRALEAAPDEQNEQRAYAQVALATALDAAGDAEQAREALSHVDEEQVPPPMRNQLQQLKEKQMPAATSDEQRPPEEDNHGESAE